MNLSAATDVSLWRKAAIGKSNDAYRELMDRHKMTVWGVCSQLLLCRDDIEEAFQVTFVALLENGDQVRSADFGPWLYRVAYRAALRVRSDSVRKTPQVKIDEHHDDQTVAFRCIEDSERSQLIAEAIDDLPKKQREVIVLHYVRGLSRDEVARILCTTAQTVKGRLGRARTTLRNRLVRRGISLGLVTAFLQRQADAGQISTAVGRTMVAIEECLAGLPVSLGKVQYSDLTRRNGQMFYTPAIRSHYSVAALCVTVILASFFIGQFSTESSGAFADDTTNLPTSPLRSTGDFTRDAESDAAHVQFVSMPQSAQPATADVPTSNKSPVWPPAYQRTQPSETGQLPKYPQPQPVGTLQFPSQPVIANVAASNSQPAAAGLFPPNPYYQPAFSPAVQPSKSRSNSSLGMVAEKMQTATKSDAEQAMLGVPQRGLPEGTWIRDAAFGKITSFVEGNQIRLSLVCGGLGGMEIGVRAEYAVASDGTVFGLVHAVDTQVTPTMMEDGRAEVLMMLNGFADVPFSLRCHSDAASVSIKSLNLGRPLNPIVKDALGDDFKTTLNALLVGTFHLDDSQ